MVAARVPSTCGEICTNEVIEFKAKIIFVNASALNTNLILLNSKSSRFPNGLGNDNGLLGKFIAFHNYRGAVTAEYDGPDDKYVYGRNPTNPIIPNYRNMHKQDTDYLGGFLTFVAGYRERGIDDPSAFGKSLKDNMSVPGKWKVLMYMQGETLPKESNQVSLSTTQTDKWGIPLLNINVDYDDNDERLLKDFLEQSSEMMAKAGCTNIEKHDNHQAPGLDIHEMGGVRMGHDPRTSLLNKWNQLHHCKNVYVTDGACMTSTGNQSPSILYMALTARAVDHAVSGMRG